MHDVVSCKCTCGTKEAAAYSSTVNSFMRLGYGYNVHANKISLVKPATTVSSQLIEGLKERFSRISSFIRTSLAEATTDKDIHKEQCNQFQKVPDYPPLDMATNSSFEYRQALGSCYETPFAKCLEDLNKTQRDCDNRLNTAPGVTFSGPADVLHRMQKSLGPLNAPGDRPSPAAWDCGARGHLALPVGCALAAVQ